jgi:hypothetical protein
VHTGALPLQFLKGLTSLGFRTEVAQSILFQLTVSYDTTKQETLLENEPVTFVRFARGILDGYIPATFLRLADAVPLGIRPMNPNRQLSLERFRDCYFDRVHAAQANAAMEEKLYEMVSFSKFDAENAETGVSSSRYVEQLHLAKKGEAPEIPEILEDICGTDMQTEMTLNEVNL